jgi:glycine/D-amino acid oxidase-like deaminating enzyme
MPDVVIVGGGIAGCTVAFEWARRGARVSLLERRCIGLGASGRNTGTLLQQAEPEVSQLLNESVGSYSEVFGKPHPEFIGYRAMARPCSVWVLPTGIPSSAAMVMRKHAAVSRFASGLRTRSSLISR